MAGRQPLEFTSRKNPLHLAAHRFVETIALLTEGVVDQQKATIGKKSSKSFDLFLAERFEFVLAGQVQKWIVEKIAIGQHDVVSDRGGFDARARHQLFHQRRDR